jgi:hypothetical protein
MDGRSSVSSGRLAPDIADIRGDVQHIVPVRVYYHLAHRDIRKIAADVCPTPSTIRGLEDVHRWIQLP